MKQRKPSNVTLDNIYQLNGRVPLSKAIPLGLQHVLAMFVANVTPIIMIAGVAQYNGIAFSLLDKALLVQAAMLIAGIGVTQTPTFFSHMPKVVTDIFSSNPVAGVFVVAMLLSLLLPKDKKKTAENTTAQK